MNMAAVYLNMGKLDSALYCSMQSLDLFPKDQDPTSSMFFPISPPYIVKKTILPKPGNIFQKPLQSQKSSIHRGSII